MSKRIITSKDKVFGLFKSVYQKMFLRNSDKKIVMIMGCMRSGTTMLSATFDKFINSSVFGEFSKLSSKDPKRLRLNPLNDILPIINKQNAELIVMKPLVESQNAIKYLSEIERSSIIWFYRDFKEVAISNIKKFGAEDGAMNNIRPIISNDQSNWRSQHASKKTRRIFEKYFSEDMNPNDAACLFWYARNIIFFEQDLQNNDRVRLWKYENFVKSPMEHLRSLCNKLNLTLPSKRVVKHVGSFSAPEVKSFEVTPEIEKLCLGLWNNLEACCRENEIKNDR